LFHAGDARRVRHLFPGAVPDAAARHRGGLLLQYGAPRGGTGPARLRPAAARTAEPWLAAGHAGAGLSVPGRGRAGAVRPGDARPAPARVIRYPSRRLPTMRTHLSLAVAVLAGGLVLPRPLAAGQPAGVTITADKQQIDFQIGKELVARYHIAPSVAKPYFWPLKAPGGVTVTRAWPMEEAGPGGTKDHPHQKSAWFCHGDIAPEGIEVTAKIRGVKGIDFWSEAKGHGRMVCTAVETPTLDPKRHAGSVTTRNEWRTSDGVKILDETRTLRL